MSDLDSLPEPATKARIAVTSAKLKYMADVAKSYGVVISGAAVITPAFTGKPMTGINVAWLVVSALLVVFGAIFTPEV